MRAVRVWGYGDPALARRLPVARDCVAPSHPAVATDAGGVAAYAYTEEEAFRHTLRSGTTIFDMQAAEVRRAGGSQLSGEKAFQLHDTYGFPIELALEMAADQGLSV